MLIVYPIFLFPNIHARKYRHGYFSGIASCSISIGSDICSKKVCVIFCFNEADKPSINILAIYTSGSCLSVECPGIGGRKADGVFYDIDVLRRKIKVIVI